MAHRTHKRNQGHARRPCTTKKTPEYKKNVSKTRKYKTLQKAGWLPDEYNSFLDIQQTFGEIRKKRFGFGKKKTLEQQKADNLKKIASKAGDDNDWKGQFCNTLPKTDIGNTISDTINCTDIEYTNIANEIYELLKNKSINLETIKTLHKTSRLQKCLFFPFSVKFFLV